MGSLMGKVIFKEKPCFNGPARLGPVISGWMVGGRDLGQGFNSEHVLYAIYKAKFKKNKNKVCVNGI